MRIQRAHVIIHAGMHSHTRSIRSAARTAHVYAYICKITCATLHRSDTATHMYTHVCTCTHTCTYTNIRMCSTHATVYVRMHDCICMLCARVSYSLLCLNAFCRPGLKLVMKHAFSFLANLPCYGRRVGMYEAH